MSMFGNARKIGIKREALDTEKWISDEDLYSIFFDEDSNNDIVNELNTIMLAFPQSNDLISVNTDFKYNETKVSELKVA